MIDGFHNSDVTYRSAHFEQMAMLRYFLRSLEYIVQGEFEIAGLMLTACRACSDVSRFDRECERVFREVCDEYIRS